MFSGYKTYFVGIVSVLSAIAAVWTGHMDFNAAAAVIVPAITAMTIRDGISKL